MFVTVILVHEGKAQVQQFEAPTVKDCLVAWAGRVQVEGLTDEGRTRLRGHMADFDASDGTGLLNVWRLESDLGLEGKSPATVIVAETVKR